MKESASLNRHLWMPPEWEPHERTLVAWPVQESMCNPENYESICAGYASFVKTIAEFEPVTVIVNAQDIEKAKRNCYSPNIEWLTLEHNDSWIRDSGPTFVYNANGALTGIDWRFNAWGEKYSPWNLDDELANKVLRHFDINRVRASLVMEGGSFSTDGEGTLLTTKECLLNQNRNPDMSADEIESELRKHLGIQKIIWLQHGLDGDETDGHIDNLACFASPGKILIQTSTDPNDVNTQRSKENIALLRHSTDAQGRSLQIVEIPQPVRADGKEGRLTLSYLNFYFVNGGIILPVFGGASADIDEEAVRIISDVFPDRKIRRADGMAIVTEGGNIHCATQQMPVRQRIVL